MNRPSVGWVVHYTETGTSDCEAAIVTGLAGDNVVHLAVLGVGTLYFPMSIPYSEDGHSDTWHWPERVE